MKSSYLLIVISISLFSCSNADNMKPEIDTLDLSVMEYPQKWQLFKMSGGMIGSETSGENMEYQEYYLFNKDLTFVKTRIEAGTEISFEGSYSIVNQNNEQGLLLEFNEENRLIGSCSSKPEEYLYLDKDNETLLSNWWACDGPGLFYKQLEIK